MVVIAGLILAWLIGVHSFAGTLLLGVVLGLAGASFAVALPLASGWYPPEHQGTALGIAGAGNSGTVLAALFAPGLAVAIGWQNVVGLAAVPLSVALAMFLLFAKDSPNASPPKPLAAYSPAAADRRRLVVHVLLQRHLRRLCRTGIVADDLLQRPVQLVPSTPATARPRCVFVGSLVRPVGGAVADRVGGVRALSLMYAVAAMAFATVATGISHDLAGDAGVRAGMLALGMGNGAVFQLVPQRFAQRSA